jgi:hypothetical protein
MPNRSFVRDSIGRFAKTAGAAATKEAKRFAKEEAADAKRVAKAKLQAAITEAERNVSAKQAELDAHDATKADQETDHEFVIWETKRKSIRDSLRKLKLKAAALRTAGAVANN